MNTSESSRGPNEQDAEAADSAASGVEPPQRAEESPAATADEETAPEGEAAATESAEDLPEHEPLTPELVEDEAQRGDFMLRWAVILLAFLLGCTKVADTATLVRIRTGEYLATHGILPPRTDVFSYTASDQPWRNLAWLGDLLLAGVYHAGGPLLLSVASGLLAAVCFWLISQTVRPGVSTWWGSVSGCLALLAVFPLLAPGPSEFTLLGLACVMWILSRVEAEPGSPIIWGLPVTLLLWAQLDEHAFLGIAVLLAYAIGHTIDRAADESIEKSGRMWTAVGAGLVAMLLHPFHYHVLLSPLTLHTEVYPELYEYSGFGDAFTARWLPMIEQAFWDAPDVPTVAGLLVSFAALVTMLLNHQGLRWSHALLWIAANALALAAGRQLFAAAVVHAGLATLNGQDWYRTRFRQTYSVETAELIFSRGGRAVTVFGLFVLGYLAASGRLMGPDTRRIGLGFDDHLHAEIASFRDVLADSWDDRPFNFRLDQGDVLIWIGRRPFIDSRVALYATADPSLTEIHRNLRVALGRTDPTDPTAGIWEEVFDRYGVTHVLPRLSGEFPDYATFLNLMQAPQWRLARLGAATAALYDRDTDDAELAEFIDAHPGADFIDQAFRGEVAEPGFGGQPVWPRERTRYEQFLMAPAAPVSNDIQLARHYSMLLNAYGDRISEDQLMALAYLSIRHAWRGLVEHPDAADGYLVLAQSYAYLLNLHAFIQQSAGYPADELLGARTSMQVQTALYNAVTCRPDSAELRLTLAQFLLSQNKPDLALEQMRAYERLHGSLATVEAEHPDYIQILEANEVAVDELQSRVAAAREEIAIELQSGAPRLQVVSVALNNGMYAEALRLLEEDATMTAQDITAQYLLGDLLLEVGRAEEAVAQLERIESPIRQQAPQLAASWLSTTAIANLALGNHVRAHQLWSEHAAELTQSRLGSLIGMGMQPGVSPSISTMPLVYAPPHVMDIRPILRAGLFADLLLVYPRQWDVTRMQTALTALELGWSDEAADTADSVLTSHPETSLRPLAAFEAAVITGEPVPFTPPSDEIPITPEIFAPDDAESEATPSASDAPSPPDSAEDAPAREENFPPPPPPAIRGADD